MTMPLPSTTSISKPKRGRWVIWLFILMLCIMALIGWFWLKMAFIVQAAQVGFQPPEMAAAQYSPRDVIGDLGGMPVTIPHYMAEYVEYDGDPGFGEKRKGPRPVRTQTSKLRSFGFDVRYPDMKGLSDEAMRKDKKSYTIYNTPWMIVGVTTGERYPGNGFLDRLTRSTLNTSSEYWLGYYRPTNKKEYGLTTYVLAGKNPHTGQLAREEKNANDLYIYRDKDDHVLAYIECSNFQSDAALCKHNWSMEEQNIHADIETLYRRDLLKHWRKIQKDVSQVILNFKTPKKELSNQVIE